MEITIKFKTDSAAFKDDYYGERRRVWEKIRACLTHIETLTQHDDIAIVVTNLIDRNGNTIGHVVVGDDPQA